MKKGIVMEQHRKYTIVMTTDGLIEKAHPIKDADIGFEVDYEPLIQRVWVTSFKNKFFTMRIAALACVFLIALLPFYMVTNRNETFAYVDIDINPSIELEINSDLVVSKIIPFNNEANLLLEQIGNLKGKEIEDAIEIIINTSEEKGLANTAKNVLIGVHYLKDGEKDPIIKTIEDHFDKKPTDWEVVTVLIPEEVRVKAEKNQQSMNKALANSVTEQSNNQEKAIITEDDKEVLQSFFNKSRVEMEITNDDSSKESKPNTTTEIKEENINSFKDEIHPRELKGKNGEIHSNKNGNGHQNGKNKGHDNDRNNEKFKNKNDKNKEKASNDYRKNKNVENSKHKNNHKHKNDHQHKEDKKDKWDKKDRKDKENNKQKGNNGKDHKNKGNNGNGKGKHKDDGYSYSFPSYK